jgi:hypothetical protein
VVAFLVVIIASTNRQQPGVTDAKPASGEFPERLAKQLRLQKVQKFFGWFGDFLNPADPSEAVKERRNRKTRMFALGLAVFGAFCVVVLCLMKGWMFRSRIEFILCALAVLVVGGVLYYSVLRRGLLAKLVPVAVVFLVLAWFSGSRPGFMPTARTQSVSAAKQGVSDRIFHCRLKPTQKDEPFLWNNNQIVLEPGHAYVLWVDGAIDLDPTDGVRQGLEAKFGAAFADPAIMQVSPESARMSPALVRKTWPSNWPMPNEPVGIPIAKVGDGLRFRLYSGEHPVKFTVPERAWDSKLTISTNLPRPDYLRGDLDNHAVFVDGTHGFYTVFLREVAD